MKKWFYVLLASFSFLYFGCDNDSGGSAGTDPFGGGGGGGGTGGVTFTVSLEQGNQGGVYFNFKPNQNVTATNMTLSLPAQNFTDNITNPNPNEVYTNAQGFSVGEYTGVATGQQWVFNIQGKIGSSTGTPYNVTINFTVP